MGWMELKDPSRAQSLLDRSFTNVTEPFKVSLPLAQGPVADCSAASVHGGDTAQPLGHCGIMALAIPA